VYTAYYTWFNTQIFHILPTQRTQVFRLILRTTAVNWLVLLKTSCVHYEMETEFVNIVEMNFFVPKATICQLFLYCANSTALVFMQLSYAAVLLTLSLHTPHNPRNTVPWFRFSVTLSPVAPSLSLSFPLLRALSHMLFTNLESEGD
jgi:hypothetical protein